MGVTPEPVDLPGGSQQWARYVTTSTQENKASIERLSQDVNNSFKGITSSLNFLTVRLGDVAAGINALILAATFDAGQVVSGTFDAARIPTLDFSKISGGSASVTSITTSSSSSVGGNLTVSGHVYVPNSTLASFGSWTVAYIDGDGRLTRGASSRRFKEKIVPAPTSETFFAAELKEFQMRGGNGWRVLGYIAEDLVGTPMERFVVWEREKDENGDYRVVRDESGNPVPLSIDFVPMLMAQNSELNQRVKELEAQNAEFEKRLRKLEKK